MTREVQVYLVDDDDSMHVLHRYLINAEDGLMVCGTATSGSAAYDAIGELDPPPDVVLVDYTLAGMTGCELIEKLLERRSGLRCVVLSGYPGLEFAEEARAAGAVAYVEKGNDEVLLSTIRRVAGGGE